MSNDAQVFCLYADDIRYEVNGKTSLIGIYQGGMVVAGPLPVLLPKLVVSIYLSTPITRPFADLRVHVLLNATVLQDISPPKEALEAMQKSGGQARDAGSFAMQLVFVLQPFEVKEAGILSVVAVADGEELAGNALLISLADGISSLQ